MEYFDVVIVGAGIAGCAAAITSAQFGLRTMIVPEEVDQYPGDFPETLAADALTHLHALGIGADLNDFPRVTARISRWGTGSASHQYMLPHGNAPLLLGKRALHTLLWRQVIDSNVAVITTNGLAHLERRNSTLIIQLSSGSDSRMVTCRFAIDASGRRAALAKQFKMRRRILDDLVSFWITDMSGNWPSHVAAAATVSDGWMFCSGSIKGATAIGFFTPGGRLRSRPTTGAILDKASSIPDIAELIGRTDVSRYSTVVSRNAASTMLLRPGGVDWIACGDALQTVDPITSSGTYLALRQGIAAAKIAERSLAEDFDPYRRFESQYRCEMTNVLSSRSRYYGGPGGFNGPSP
jgi:flavin-dependent dehydrogenase